MESEYSPVIYLFRDALANAIYAASIKRGPFLEDGCPVAINYAGKRFERIRTIITFWDHLLRDGRVKSPVLGISLYLMRPDDNALLDSPFCRLQSSNMTIHDAFLHEIVLTTVTDRLSSDSAQAFGSQYYSDGENVIVGLGGWPDIHYAFPIIDNVLYAAE